jgi:NADH-quinone oxidoreductase subunit H
MRMVTISDVLSIVIFPGALFIIVYALYCNWLTRKTVARLQNRRGPMHTGYAGLLQPLADFIKLLAKEDITPGAANKPLFSVAPLLIFALPLATLFLIPIQSITNLWSYTPIASFEGDLVIVLLLLSLTVLSVFLAGWSSSNLFGAVGATRVALLMLAYEIPLVLLSFGPAIMAGSLSISKIVDWEVSSVQSFIATPSIWGIMLGVVLFLGFCIYIICLLAELEMRPFDMAEAETEIVHGWQVEFSGKKLALLTLGRDVKIVLASALLTSLFLGGPAGPILPPIVWFILKTTFCVLILSNLSALFARFRIDQMLKWAWQYLTPLAVLTVMAIVALSGVI